MSTYAPPSKDQINFDLIGYTPVAKDQINFDFSIETVFVVELAVEANDAFEATLLVEPRIELEVALEVNEAFDTSFALAPVFDAELAIERNFAEDVSLFVTLPPPFGPVVTGTPPYRVVIADLGGAELEEVPFKNLQYSFALNEPGSCSFTLSLFHEKATRALLDPGRREVIVYREGQRVWGGYLWFAGGQTSDAHVRFSAEGYLSRLKRRDIDEDKIYEQVEQLDIAWDLIEFTQSKVSGDLGITRAPKPDSGRLRDRSYRFWERQNLFDVLHSFTGIDDGFDIDIDADKVWHAYYPSKGQDTDLTFELGKNIENLHIEYDAHRLVSEMSGLGAGDDKLRCIVVVNDAQVLTDYGLLQDSESWPDVKRFATVEAKTTAELELRRRIRHQPQISVVATDDPPLFSYFPGDRVKLVADQGYLQADQKFTITALVVQPADSGRESITTFMQELGP